MRRDEGVVEAPGPFQLSRQGPGQYHICTRLDGQMQIGFACHRHTARIDHHQLGTAATGSVDVGHEVHLRDGDIVAPDKNQLRLSHVFRSHQGDSAVGAYEGFTFHATAQRTARQIRGAKPVKEAEIHRTAGEKAMRTGIVERYNRLSTECLLHVCKTRINKIQGLLPCDASELAGPLGASTFEGGEKAVRTMHEFGVVADFGANRTTCEWIDA